MTFKPDKRAGIISAIIILLTIISIQALVISNFVDQRVGPGQYLTAVLFLLTLPLLLLWAYWFHQLLTLSYQLDRDSLTVRCGWLERVVPLSVVDRCLLGQQVSADATFHGVSWPGFMHGHLHLREIGRVQTYSTAPLARQVILVCGGDGQSVAEAGRDALTGSTVSLAISPKDQALFLQTLQRDLEMGPLHETEAALVWRGVAAWPVWRDRPFWILVSAAVVLGLGLYGLLAWRYGALPSRLPLHYDARGLPDRIDVKERLFIVPFIGTLATLVNVAISLLLHRRERMAALILAGSTVGIVAVLWVALVGLVY